MVEGHSTEAQSVPRSKHWSKSGGRADAHPGRPTRRGVPRKDRARRDEEEACRRRFQEGYARPFRERYESGITATACFLLVVVELKAFDPTDGGHLRSISKAELIREAIDPQNPAWEGDPPDLNTALTFLVEQGMVEVDGDTITVPDRFWCNR
jgi:hypothetical protein